jgi:hypothetical protein
VYVYSERISDTMRSVKNKTTEEKREFWSHVEGVAQRVRSSPTYANYKMTDRRTSDSSLTHSDDQSRSVEDDDQQGSMPRAS